jgi:HEXXH motif-containing protein
LVDDEDFSHERLWISDEPVDRRWEESAAALVAIRRALAEGDPSAPAEREFLRLYAWAAERGPDLFTAAWQAPATLAWVRRTYDSLGRALAEGAPRDGLHAQLAHFKAVALGMAVAGGHELAFDDPYDVELPFSVPGAGKILEGVGRVAILGASAGAVRLRAAGAELRPAPSVEVGPCRVQLDPFALRGLGADFPEVRPALAAGLDFQRANAGLVRAALEAVRRHAPDPFAQLAHAIRCIALKPPRDDDPTSNVTVNELPGAFVALRIAEPLDLADTFVHELHHNRLFCLEDAGGPLFEGEQEVGAEAERHYSPWREDLRPARGILHAVYVTLPVVRYWLRVQASGEAAGPLADYARDRVRRGELQLEIGLAQLGRFARFTPRGKALFAALARRRDEVREEIAASGIARDVPACYCTTEGEVKPEREAPDGRALGVRESVARHAARHDVAREAALPE